MAVSSSSRGREQQECEEDEERIGELESVVRFWVAESCLEILADSKEALPSVQMIVLMMPLVYASQNAGKRRDFIAAAMFVSWLRRVLTSRNWESLVDATMACGIASSMSTREAEIVACFAPLVRSEMAVASIALTIHVLSKRSWWALVPLASYVAYSRRSIMEGSGVRASARARLASDFGRFCCLVTLYNPDLQMAAGSRMFLIMPSAATEALDEMVFVDLVFAAICFSCFCLAARDDFVVGYRSSENIYFYLRLGYSITVAIFVVRACWIDRSTQADVSANSRSDLPPKPQTQRALQYENLEERYKTFNRKEITVVLACSIAVAIFHLYQLHNSD